MLLRPTLRYSPQQVYSLRPSAACAPQRNGLLLDLGIQLALLIELEHALQRDGFDFGRLTGGAKRLIAGNHDIPHRLDRLRQVFTRVELGLVSGQITANRTR